MKPFGVKFYILKGSAKLPLLLAFCLLFSLMVGKTIPTIHPDLDRLVDKTVIQFKHYDFQITADSQKGPLNVDVTAKLEVISDRVHQIQFLLNGLNQIRIDRLTINGRPLEYHRQGDVYQVDLPFSCFKGKKLALSVRYRIGKAPSSSAVLAELRGNWYPKNLLPEWVTATFRLNVPAGIIGVANGRLIRDETGPGGRGIYQWRTMQAITALGVSLGRYQEYSTTNGDQILRLYTVPGIDIKTVAQLSQWAEKISRYYAEEFGFEAAQECTLVINDTPSGESAFGSLVYLHLEKTDRPEDLFWGLAHEISHYWWGNVIIPETVYDWWLVEGFANYSAWMASERVRNQEHLKLPSGQIVLANWRERYQETLFNLERYHIPEMSLAEISPYDIQRELLYTKGPFVAHMIRQMLGDEEFGRYLREFVAQNAYHPVAIRAFTRLGVHRYGAQLLDFYRQWVYSAGQYNLAITGATLVKKNETEYSMTLKIQNIGQLYLPDTVRLEIITEGRVYSEVLQFQGVNDTIQKTFPFKPLKVMLNPRNDILEVSNRDNLWNFSNRNQTFGTK